VALVPSVELFNVRHTVKRVVPTVDISVFRCLAPLQEETPIILLAILNTVISTQLKIKGLIPKDFQKPAEISLWNWR
jgi:hypothetical protein